ncbi:MAG: hypothetical protein R3F13_18565 [Prosthecobacter sp.]
MAERWNGGSRQRGSDLDSSRGIGAFNNWLNKANMDILDDYWMIIQPLKTAL